MFAQLCSDLPWTQRLSEVWRMRDPDERAASLALRDGGPNPVRRAVDWYRGNGRLHTGDEIAMAHDAMEAYRADTTAGKDALLVCGTKKMADALNGASTTRRSTPTRPPSPPPAGTVSGWGIWSSVAATTPLSACSTPPTSASRRLIRCATATAGACSPSTPNTTASPPAACPTAPAPPLAVITCANTSTHGYAVTVHSAQGVTADTTHAVLGETTSRAMLYVALTRGRDTNSAYLYERMAGEGEHEHAQPDGLHILLLRRGSGRDAAQLVRGIIANHDEQARTAHDIATEPPTASSCRTVSAGCSTVAPTPYTPGGRPTNTGANKPPSWSPNGRAGSSSTSAEAATRASTTASTSKPGPTYPLC